MCVDCLIKAVLTGKLSMAEVKGSGSLEAAIKMAQKKLGLEEMAEETPAAWRARTIDEMTLDIKTKEVVLHYVSRMPEGTRALSIVGNAHKKTHVMQLIVIYDTPDGMFHVHEHYPANTTQDHTWRAPSFEIAEAISESVVARLDAEAEAEMEAAAQ
jgi:hypothetical protein